MNHLRILAALIATVAIMSAPLADAQSRKNGEKAKDVAQSEAQEISDNARAEKNKAKQGIEKRKDKARDAMEDASDEDSESDDSERDDSERDDAPHEASEEEDRAARGMDNAASRGNEKSQEMRARRDERKAMKEEYKTGDNGEIISVDGTADSLDADNETESNEKKEKKPWWKFWDQ